MALLPCGRESPGEGNGRASLVIDLFCITTNAPDYAYFLAFYIYMCESYTCTFSYILVLICIASGSSWDDLCDGFKV
jgi:hypothetical protein